MHYHEPMSPGIETADGRERRVPWFLAPFQRVTTSGRFLPPVDGLRAILLVMVLAIHVRGWVIVKLGVPPRTSFELAMEWCLLTFKGAVPVFFAISGFILAMPFARKHLRGGRGVSLHDYVFRRISRVEPPFLCSMVLLTGYWVVAKGLELATLLPHLMAACLYLHGPVYGGTHVINPVAWSLEVEVQFYILAPILANVFRIANQRLRRLVLVAGMTLAPWALSGYCPDPENLLTSFQFFLAGFLLTELLLHEWEDHLALPGSPGWDLAWVLAWVAFPYAVSSPVAYRCVFPGVVFVLVAGTFRGRWVPGLLSGAWLTAIGGMSYTAYLYHFVLMGAVGRFTGALALPGSFAGNVVLQTAVMLGPILLLCAPLFLLFEKPFMYPDWPRRLRGLLRPAA